MTRARNVKASAKPELVDVVNAKDDVVGTATLADVHAKGLRHRFVHVLVVDANGLVLVQWRGYRKRADGTTKFYPRMFSASVGGHVLAGETYEQAARREMKEELGITVRKLERLGRIKHDDVAQKERMVGEVFLATCSGNVKGWEDEADAIDWFNADELDYLTKRMEYLFTYGLLSSWSVARKAVHALNPGE